jgi:hypothetical protein
MPVNNKQLIYETIVNSGKTPKEAFEEIGVKRACCRRMLYSACNDPRLRRRLPEVEGFATVIRASRLSAKPFTLKADGSMPPTAE